MLEEEEEEEKKNTTNNNKKTSNNNKPLKTTFHQIVCELKLHLHAKKNKKYYIQVALF
jgi:hypothetical protein